MKVDFIYKKALPYNEYISLAEDLIARQRESLVLCDHSSVITLGRGLSGDKVFKNPSDKRELQTFLVSVSRGGEATAHEEGQLILYPVLNLRQRKIKIGNFVRLLEATVLEFLEILHPKGKDIFTLLKDKPGIYVKEVNTAEKEYKKIASIGLKIQKGFSLHGIALNLYNNLELFSKIIACGEAGRQAVSLELIYPFWEKDLADYIKNTQKSILHYFTKNEIFSGQRIIIEQKDRHYLSSLLLMYIFLKKLERNS